MTQGDGTHGGGPGTTPPRAARPRVPLGGLLGAAALGLWLGVAALRCAHPFELEWQEGGLLGHTARVRAGLPLYVEPGPGFCPFPYPPLFPWLGALAESVLGPGFLALRVVSIAATLGLLALLVRGLRARAASWTGVGLAVATIALGHAYAGAWLDVARPDALAWCLSLAAVSALLRGGLALPVALTLLAFLAKQTAPLPVLACATGLALDPASRRRAAAFALGSALGLLALLGLAEWRTGPWFRFHVLELLAGHATHWSGGREYLFLHLPWLLPSLVLLPRVARRHGAGLAAALVGGHLAALVGSLHVGAFENVLLPGLVAAGATVGLALVGPRPGTEPEAPRGPGATRGVLVLAWLQALLFLHDPRPLVPTAADRAAGERVVETLRALRASAPGGDDLWLPAHGYLAERAGAPPQLHWMTFLDLSASDAGLPHAERLIEGWDRRFTAGEYAAAVVGAWRGEGDVALRAFLERHLRLTERLFPVEDSETFVPVTGAARRPELVYRP